MTPKEYVESGKHLPGPLKDFHDTKDVFKLLHRLFAKNDNGTFEYANNHVSWVLGQCYVIDWFLWFMAQRGYTLQKSRAKVDFRDLADEIKQMKAEDAEIFRQMLAERKNEPPVA